MTHQEKLSALTQKILEAVPDIPREEGDFCPRCQGDTKSTGFDGPDGMFCIECELNDYHKTVEWLKWRTSRDINLEDVLRAMQPTRTARHGDITVGPWGRINVFYDETDFVSEWCEWGLGIPLNDQPPETISFLHSLLCPQ